MHPWPCDQLLVLAVFASVMAWGAIRISRLEPSPVGRPNQTPTLRRIGTVLGGLALVTSALMFIYRLAVAFAMEG